MIVFGAPRRYVQGPGLIETIGTEIASFGSSAIFLADRRITDLAADTVEKSCTDAGISLTRLLFRGEITYAEVDRLADELGGETPEIVVAAGGGKAIDTGKMLSRKIGAKFVSVPTVASNDAPTSHIAVMYDENHRLVGVEKNKANPELVLVDTAIIANAPLRLLSAGVGDALVKCFEVEQCIRAGGKNVFGATPPMAAMALADACYDTVRKHTTAAYRDLEAGEPSDDLEKLVEACILMSGLAFESGGLSVSHGMTRGLSAVDGVADALHGHQVAYGLLVQLVLEERGKDFMADMRGFYREAKLPLTLADLGLKGDVEAGIRAIAEPSAEAAHMQKFDRPVTVDGIVRAMQAIEAAA